MLLDPLAGQEDPRPESVSYTHLDVYKRQDGILCNIWRSGYDLYGLCFPYVDLAHDQLVSVRMTVSYTHLPMSMAR